MTKKNDEIQKLIFNGYNFKAEWNTSDFNVNVPKYDSPLFSCDNFEIKLTLYNNVSNSDDVLSISFEIITITQDIFLTYSLIIINENSKKSVRINDNEIIAAGKEENRVPIQLCSNDITSESGFLQNGTLQIHVFFMQEIFTPQAENLVNNSTDWFINTIISDFQSTDYPLELKIKEKPLRFALLLEKNDKNTYTLSIILVEPEISFDGEIEVNLNNHKYSSKTITQSEKVKFDPDKTDIEPFNIDLKTEDFLNPKSGWIVYDKQTKDIKEGVHFTITFRQSGNNEGSIEKDEIVEKLPTIKMQNVKYLKSERPLTVNIDKSGLFNIDLKYPKDIDFEQAIHSRVFHTGEIVIQFVLDAKQKKLLMKIIDSLSNEKDIDIIFVCFNTDTNLSDLHKFVLHYSQSNEEFSFDMPFSIDDLNDDKKGWIMNNNLNIRFQIDGSHFDRQWLENYTYPIYEEDNISGFHGWEFFVPFSLFEKGSNLVVLNPITIDWLNISLSLRYDIDQSTCNLFIKPILKVKSQEESVLHLFLTIENKDSQKSISYKFIDIQTTIKDLPQLYPRKSFEEDGFLFKSDSIEKNIKISIRFFYIGNNTSNSLKKPMTDKEIENDDDDENKDKSENKNKDKSENKNKDKSDKESDSDKEEEKIEIKLPRRRSKKKLLKNKKSAKKKSKKTEKKEIPLKGENVDAINDMLNKKKDTTSKKEKSIGYVGLKNQCRTCYMNSVLQALFHLPAFRKIIYEMPTSDVDDDEKSIPLNLQRLFYKMQFNNESCSTVDLTNSFGWFGKDVEQDRDAEEFLLLFINKLEECMKGTDQEDSIAKLLRGRCRQCIKCKNVDFQSVNEEYFYDLSMDVSNIKNLYESFNNLLEQDELVGKYQYETSKYGKQDAIMQKEFVEFPPVLYIKLNRIVVNPINGKMDKINDRYEYPVTIDLKDYLADDSPYKSKPNIYDLYGVIVHQGNKVDEGHYYAILRTSTSPNWYRFNDSNVSGDSQENATYGNYGNSVYEDGDIFNHSAYILIYVRREEAESIYKPIKEESIPTHIMHTKDLIKIQFVFESILRKNSINRINGFFPPYQIRDYNSGLYHEISFARWFDKSITTCNVYEIIASKFHLEPTQIILWNCNSNDLPNDPLLSSVDRIINEYFENRNENKIIIQQIDELSNLNNEIESPNNIAIFIKFFFSEDLLRRQQLNGDDILKKQLQAPLQYLESMIVKTDDNIESLVPLINNKIGLDADSKLDAYRYEQSGNVKKLSLDKSFSDNHVSNCSILIFQVNPETIEKIPNNSLRFEFEFELENSTELFEYKDEANIHDSLRTIENYIISEFGRCTNKLNDMKKQISKENMKI